MNKSKINNIYKINTGIIGISLCASMLSCYPAQTAKATSFNKVEPLTINSNSNKQQLIRNITPELPNRNQLFSIANNVTVPDQMSEPSGTWDNVDYNYDKDSQILTIKGGTLDSVMPIFRKFGYDQIKEVNITGKIILKNNANFLFAGLKNCTAINGLDNVDTSQVTSMDGMFGAIYVKTENQETYINGTFTTLNIGNWDISKVTNTKNMFYSSEITNVDVSKWQTGNITNMNGMFSNCSNLKSLDVSNWNTSKATDTSRMFTNCNALAKLDVSHWQTSNITDMSEMFNNCSSLTTIAVDNWDTSKVENMASMFDRCSSITELDLSKWNTESIKAVPGTFFGHGYSFMFANCDNLQKLNISSFDTTMLKDSPRDLEGMLTYLSKLKELHVGSKTNLQNTDLNTPVTWVTVGKGTVEKPTGNEFYSSDKLTKFWNNQNKTDIWVPGIKAQITINYVDLDDSNKVLKSDSLSGVANNTIDYKTNFDKIVNSLKEQHYVYDKNEDKLPWTDGQIKLPDNGNDNPVYTVGFRHETTTVKPGEKNPATGKVDDNQSQTIKQTIKYNGVPNSIADNVQSLTFNRDAKVDLVTGKTTYLDWDKASQSFKDIDSPSFDGYDVDIKTVKGETVKPDDKDIIKNVTYTKAEAPKYDITINYIDSDDGDKIVKSDKQSGKAGTTIPYHEQMQNIIKQIGNGNYEIDKDKSSLPLDANGDIKLPNDLNSNSTYKVVLKHKIITLKPGDKNPLTNKEEADQTKTITQTIKYSGTDKDIPNNVQTVKFNRNTQVDLVTGKVEYLDWNESEQSFKDVDSPTITGYSADIKTVKGTTVKPDDNDITKTVTYTKVNSNEPDYNITINYQDENGKIIKTDQQKGKANSTIPYKDRIQDIINSIAKGSYEIDKDKSNLPLDENGDIKLPDINNDTTYKLVLKHKVLIFKHGEKNPFTGEEDPNLERKVTQTIEYHGSSQALPYNTQTLTFTRSAQVDMVTGKVEYLKWNENKQTFKDVKSPFVKGYTADLPVVKGRMVTGNSKDIVQIVTYHKSNIVQTGLDIAKKGLPAILGMIVVAFAGILSYFGIIKKKK